jgi:hypothetical protein
VRKAAQGTAPSPSRFPLWKSAEEPPWARQFDPIAARAVPRFSLRRMPGERAEPHPSKPPIANALGIVTLMSLRATNGSVAISPLSRGLERDCFVASLLAKTLLLIRLLLLGPAPNLPRGARLPFRHEPISVILPLRSASVNLIHHRASLPDPFGGNAVDKVDHSYYKREKTGAGSACKRNEKGPGLRSSRSAL